MHEHEKQVCSAGWLSPPAVDQPAGRL